MSYQVISRKYRPQTFAEIVGQEHICTLLQNALRLGRIAHAYLFTGSRGIGKTSTARILAKALNCSHPQEFNPCNVCTNCQEITNGRSLDVIEIDGASNRGIDQIRDLRENVKYPPATGKYRIFIIDEVHMLTKEAFNALLKTLEEPPPHVIFIFATTEPLKVPATIISRCQRYDFHRISVNQIVSLLQRIVQAENLSIAPDVLTLIARKADGALRDAESLLEQLIAFAPERQDLAVYQKILGLVDYEYHFKIGNLINNHDLNGLIQVAGEIFDSGLDVNEFLTSLLEHWRNLLIARLTGSVAMLELPPTIQQQYAEEAQRWSPNDLLRMIRLINEAQINLRYTLNSRIHLEFTLLRLGAMDKTVTIQELLETFRSPSYRPPIPSSSKSTLGLFSQATAGESRNAGSQTPSTPASPSATIPKSQDIHSTYQSSNAAVETTVAAAADGLNLERISAEWNNIILHVENGNRSLAGFLQTGQPLKLMNNILEIGFTPDNEFAQRTVTTRAKSIEDVLKSIFGVALKVRCVQIKTEGAQEIKKKPIDELTAAARDLFNGEILK